jgi:hypothetical protein
VIEDRTFDFLTEDVNARTFLVEVVTGTFLVEVVAGTFLVEELLAETFIFFGSRNNFSVGGSRNTGRSFSVLFFLVYITTGIIKSSLFSTIHLFKFRKVAKKL